MTEPSSHADLAPLASPTAWAPAAAGLLAGMGFRVVQGDRPGLPGGANLLVALRDAPELSHVDPEHVAYWAAIAGRGQLAEIDRRTPVPSDVEVEWGNVHVVDRFGEENRFMTLGGRLRAAAIDDRLTVVSLHSPAPIVRWSGHSQGVDALAGEVGAWFARIMVPVDFVPGAEARLAATPPLVLYAAFLDDTHRRLAHLVPLGGAEASLTGRIAAEAARVRAEEPAAWAAALELEAYLSLDHPSEG